MQRGAYARRTDPETSHWAAGSVDVSALEREVLWTMKILGGDATTAEISDTCGIPLGSITPRMKPLEELGLIRRTKERRGEPSRIVWRRVKGHPLKRRTTT